MQTINTKELYQLYQQKLLKVIAAKTKDIALAQDIVQATFLKAITTKSPLQNNEAAFAWLLRIAKNELAGWYKKQTKNLTAETNIEAIQQLTKSNDEVCNKPIQEYVIHKLDSLPLPYKKALIHADMNGQPQHQLAAAENLSISAIKSRVQRGRQKLKTAVEKDCAVDTDTFGNVLDCTSKIPNCSCG
jgi:RNA polymerase sigma-70 factor, ECF subfamily